jgi:hypothetical protein
LIGLLVSVGVGVGVVETVRTHGPPFGPLNPGLHVQPVEAVQLLQDAPELAGHAAHVVA